MGQINKQATARHVEHPTQRAVGAARIWWSRWSLSSPQKRLDKTLLFHDPCIDPLAFTCETCRARACQHTVHGITDPAHARFGVRPSHNAATRFHTSSPTRSILWPGSDRSARPIAVRLSAACAHLGARAVGLYHVDRRSSPVWRPENNAVREERVVRADRGTHGLSWRGIPWGRWWAGRTPRVHVPGLAESEHGDREPGGMPQKCGLHRRADAWPGRPRWMA